MGIQILNCGLPPSPPSPNITNTYLRQGYYFWYFLLIEIDFLIEFYIALVPSAILRNNFRVSLSKPCPVRSLTVLCMCTTYLEIRTEINISLLSQID